MAVLNKLGNVMKSTVFILNANDATVTGSSGFDYTYVFEIDLLRAYAIEHYKIQIGALSAFPDTSDSLVDNKLTIQPGYELDDELGCRLTIYHHGIRDYSLLFPTVTNLDLRERLGLYYQEAESAFESGSWLSFMLMSGALFEGMLHHKLGGNDQFASLISRINDMSETDIALIQKIKNFRNLVHASRFNEPYVTRADAMDIKIILDRMLRTI
ncbi:hypothetical protein NTE05_005074 [Vibrio harveyi]|nr:hypothetical protein [Vibrio harveyi]